MNYDMAYAAFNGTLPNDLREAIYYGSDVMRQRIIKTHAAIAQQKRCLEIVQSLCAWRQAPYAISVRERMLHMLSHALSDARSRACRIFYA